MKEWQIMLDHDLPWYDWSSDSFSEWSRDLMTE